MDDQIRINLEAAAFRRLLQPLRETIDVASALQMLPRVFRGRWGQAVDWRRAAPHMEMADEGGKLQVANP